MTLSDRWWMLRYYWHKWQASRAAKAVVRNADTVRAHILTLEAMGVDIDEVRLGVRRARIEEYPEN